MFCKIPYVLQKTYFNEVIFLKFNTYAIFPQKLYLENLKQTIYMNYAGYLV